MRFKFIAIAIGSFAILLTSMDANALNATSSSNSCQTQAHNSNTLPGFSGIELTAEQKNKIQGIEDHLRSEILALLTPTQLGRLVKILQQQGTTNEAVFASLSLSAAQRKKLAEIFRFSQQEVMETLTSAQLEQLRQQAAPVTPVEVEQLHRTISPFGY